MMLIYLGAFLIGFTLFSLSFKWIQPRLNLVLFLFSIPYMILVITSIPEYYPQTDEWRFIYFIFIIGSLIGYAIKEKKEKNKLSN